MFCEKCGKELADDALFCSACGTAVKAKEETKVMGGADPEEHKDTKQRRKSNTIIVCLVVVIVILAIILVGMAIAGSGAFNEPKQQSIMAFDERKSSSAAPQPSTVASEASVETPRSVVEGYLKNFDKAVNSNSITPIASYMRTDSPIYKSQKDYVQTSIKINLEKYEIVNEKMESDNRCIVTSRASYYVNNADKPREYLTEECQYVLEKSGGHWLMTDFADEVKIIERTQR